MTYRSGDKVQKKILVVLHWMRRIRTLAFDVAAACNNSICCHKTRSLNLYLHISLIQAKISNVWLTVLPYQIKILISIDFAEFLNSLIESLLKFGMLQRLVHLKLKYSVGFFTLTEPIWMSNVYLNFQKYFVTCQMTVMST